MAKASAPGVHRHGSARQEADSSSVGYVSSGESIWSRNAASPGNIKTRSFVEPNPRGEGKARIRGPRSQRELLLENQWALAKLRELVSIETDPARLKKLCKNVEIKTRFIERLASEK